MVLPLRTQQSRHRAYATLIQPDPSTGWLGTVSATFSAGQKGSTQRMSVSAHMPYRDPMTYGRRISQLTTRRARQRALSVMLAAATAFGGAAAVLPAHPTTAYASTNAVIYDDSLAGGWANWSWSSSVDFNATPAYSGAYAIGWQTTNSWGGLYLHTDSPVQTTSGTVLHVAIRASAAGEQFGIGLYGQGNQPISNGSLSLTAFGGAPAANAWTVYAIPLSALGAAGQAVTGITIQDFSGGAQPPALIDDLTLQGIADSGSTAGSGSSNCGAPSYPEIRAANTASNMTTGALPDLSKVSPSDPFYPYYAKITGACSGTTEQILEWAAKKWGFDQLGYPDLAKAMAVVESWWYQSTIGAHGEVGILQVNPCCWPDWQKAQQSTAFDADYAMAVVRMHYDGNSWLGAGTKGNLRDAVAAWECGCGYNGSGNYATRVFNYYVSKPWQHPGQPPDWF